MLRRCSVVLRCCCLLALACYLAGVTHPAGARAASTLIPAAPPDINGDGRIDLFDISRVIDAMNSDPVDPSADLDGDGHVGINDLILVLEAAGATVDEDLGCPPKDCDLDPRRPGNGEDDDGDEIPHPCPDDHDCDGIPDHLDCESSEYAGEPCSCLTDEGIEKLDADDDCDGIPNRLDCDSPCYQPDEDPDGDCACMDDDGDCIPNQSDPDSSCYIPHPPAGFIHLDIPEAPEAARPGCGGGAFLLVNDGDSDADGIVDWADGFNGLAEVASDDESANDTFLPVILTVSAPDITDARVTFDYIASDPMDGTVDQKQGVYDYTPAPGQLRLWLRDAAELRRAWTLQAGGDFIDPDSPVLLSTLGITDAQRSVTLWIEGIETSQAPADTLIRVTLEPGPDADPVPEACRHASVAMTCYGLGLAAITGARSLAPVMTAPLSVAAPTIDITQLLFDNHRISADDTHLLADLTLQGSVDDAVCDLTPGPDGVIPHLEVLVNGRTLIGLDEEPITIPLSVTKTQTDNLLTPFDYRGTFDIAIHDIRIQPGVNQVQVIATNPLGGVGFATGGTDIDVIPPPDDHIEIEAAFSAEPYLAGMLALTVTKNGATIGPLVLVPSGEPGHFVSDGIGAGRAYSELLLRDASPQSPFTLDDVLVEITVPDLDITAETAAIFEVSPENNVFTGTRIVLEHERTTYRDYQIEVHEDLTILPSSPGAVHPFALQVQGPDDPNIEIEVEIGGEIYQAISWEGGLYLAHQDALMPRAFTMVKIESDRLFTPIEDYLSGQYGFSAYLSGVGRGLLDTGAGFVDGVKTIAETGWHLAVNYNTPVVIWRVVAYGRPLTAEDNELFWTGVEFAEAIAPVLWDLFKHEASVYYAISIGHPAGGIEIERQRQVAIQVCAELIMMMQDYQDSLTDYEVGRISGRILGEAIVLVIEAVATAGTVAVITKSTLMVRLAARLRQVGSLTSLPNFVQKLDTLEEIAEQIDRSSICFPTGTPVWTTNGPLAIEMLEHGTRIRTWNPSENAAEEHTVTALISTAPSDLCSLIFERPGGGVSELTCTPTHPIWIERVQDYVPAGDLLIGDEVRLLNGDHATLTRIRGMRAPPGCSFTTYNIEVADAHTYCAGDWGILVHNEGAICETLAAAFRQIQSETDARGFDALEQVIRKIKSNDSAVELTGTHLREILLELSRDSFSRAVTPDGVDLSVMKTARELQNMKRRNALLKNRDLDVHHIVPKYIAEYLYRRRFPDASAAEVNEFVSKLDDMPAILIHKKDHVGVSDGVASFHNILLKRQELPGTLEILTMRNLPEERVLEKLIDAYREWGYPDASKVARDWVETKIKRPGH